MKTRFEKTMRITSDLMMYCHHNGARELNTNIIEADDRINYVVNAYPVELSTEMLDGMILRLNAPRQKEIEQDYWELMGESEDFSELTLVGMLCDEATVMYEDKRLIITLLRYD